MTPEQQELWQRICDYSLDEPDAAFPFSAKLARENRWSGAFGRRATEEYKRFCFLASAAGHPVSPSEVVDQVWHLHLMYTDAYWNHFCKRVLKRPLHHHPSKGGGSEWAKFEDWYEKTLDSYRSLFESEPPADKWPDPLSNRKARHHFVRIDRAKHWILPKPGRRHAVVSLILAVLLIAFGCAQQSAGSNPLEMAGPDFLLFYCEMVLTAIIVGLLVRWVVRFPAGGDTTVANKLDPFEVAYLNGGPSLAVNTAIASLAFARQLEVQLGAIRLVDPRAANTTGHPLLKSILLNSGTRGFIPIQLLRGRCSRLSSRCARVSNNGGFRPVHPRRLRPSFFRSSSPPSRLRSGSPRW